MLSESKLALRIPSGFPNAQLSILAPHVRGAIAFASEHIVRLILLYGSIQK